MPREQADGQRRPAPDCRRVCFVTGTRAEFGLMERTLRAVAAHPKLVLQIVATGMHLDEDRGRSLANIRKRGWHIDKVVRWPRSPDPSTTARSTGRAMSELARAFDELNTDIVLVVGDRVEAFSAAAGGHVSGRVVAHVHGGDRALGLVDDSLRHAITKLSHIHFSATPGSARRIRRLGEDDWRVHLVGAPGIEGITRDASRPLALAARYRKARLALVVLHPASAEDAAERRRAQLILDEVRRIPFDAIDVILPNNDPGSGGIIDAYFDKRNHDPRLMTRANHTRDEFLALLRHCAVLIGNSSSGIIEAASFGTPVVDIGPRQEGRERSGNAVHVPYSASRLREALRRIWNDGRPRRWRGVNVYGGNGTAGRIVRVLAGVRLDKRMRRKLIAY